MFYFVTIDKTSLESQPTKNDYQKVIQSVLNKNGLYTYRLLKCFEYKLKESDKWLHFHAIMESKQYVEYALFQKKGYHIRVSHLKSSIDLANACSYIIKDKVDGADITGDYYNSKVKEYQQFHRSLNKGRFTKGIKKCGCKPITIVKYIFDSPPPGEGGELN